MPAKCQSLAQQVQQQNYDLSEGCSVHRVLSAFACTWPLIILVCPQSELDNSAGVDLIPSFSTTNEVARLHSIRYSFFSACALVHLHKTHAMQAHKAHLGTCIRNELSSPSILRLEVACPQSSFGKRHSKDCAYIRFLHDNCQPDMRTRASVQTT